MNKNIELFLINSKLQFTRKAGCLIFTEGEFEKIYSKIISQCSLFCEKEDLYNYFLSEKKYLNSKKSNTDSIFIGWNVDSSLFLSSIIFEGTGNFEYAQEHVKQLGNGEWRLPTLNELELISRVQAEMPFHEYLLGAHWSSEAEGDNAWVGNFMNGGGMNPILTNKNTKRFIRAITRVYP